MRMPLLLAAFAAVLMFAAAACGDGKSDEPTPTGNELTDEQYLAVFCTGIVNYQDALVSQPSAAGIGDAIKTYVAELKKVQPPVGIAKWHKEYIQYLEDAVKDPTSLVSTKPPMPPEAERSRLASKVKDVPACKYSTFLGTS
ncbi:MAG: hypothetical protein IT302_14385 [Dehalococcoidia bacterium]|nr:hypothetical protein [Dehalococcoidia bacterium]